MDFFTLDTLSRREYSIEKYKSFIWKQRFSAYGDFELVTPATPANRQLLAVGTMIGCSESFYVMMVKTVEDSTSEDGERLLTVTGFSLEQLLEDRIAADALTDTETIPKWVITDTPGEICRYIYREICHLGRLDASDIFDLITPTYVSEDTIPEPTDIITVELEPQTVYKAIKDLADRWNLGFRIARNEYADPLYFDIYMGNDRTSGQTTLPAVIFSPELENLQNTTELKSVVDYKNCAYVFSPAGFELVYPDDIAAGSTGFERHVLMINMTDIEVGDPDASLKMIYKGYDELEKYRAISAFDGEVSPKVEYDVDYVLGDLVELRNSNNDLTFMRVTEQIFVSDAEGDRAFPTLTAVPFDESGSWALGYSYKKWEDMGGAEWEDQP